MKDYQLHATMQERGCEASSVAATFRNMPAYSVAPAPSLFTLRGRRLRASKPCRITCRCEIRSCRWRCKERGGEAAFVGATSKEGLRAPVKALTLLCAATPP